MYLPYADQYPVGLCPGPVLIWRYKVFQQEVTSEMYKMVSPDLPDNMASTKYLVFYNFQYASKSFKAGEKIV